MLCPLVTATEFFDRPLTEGVTNDYVLLMSIFGDVVADPSWYAGL